MFYRNTRGGYSSEMTGRTHRVQVRLVAAVLLIVLVVGGGTIGYALIEGWPLLDSLYMTVITMTTVGYGETRPLSDEGRWFTLLLIVTSIGLAGYAVSALAAFIVEGEFARIIRERRMDQRIAKLENHIVVCGAGRTGQHIALELYRAQTPFVLIERESPVLADAIEMIGRIPYLQADATLDETLETARIEHARGLIAALGEDKDNVFLVLSARAMNANLRIVARVIDESNTGKLKKAGADEIVSPNAIGGLRMASVMLRPTVVSFLDEMLRVPNQTLRVEELHVDRIAYAIGRSLGELNISRRTGMLVMAIKPAAGGYRFNPGADTQLRAGDILIVIGTPEQIAALHALEG
jgi:voltage-gated potassium channel